MLWLRNNPRNVWWPNSFRYLRRLGVVSSSAEQTRVELSLGYARFALAMLAIIAVVLDSTEPAAYADLVYILLIVWTIFSAGVIAWLKSRGMSPRTSTVLHVFDVVWPALITVFTHGPSSPFFPLFTFAQIGAAFRWGFGETLATSFIGIALLDGEGLMLTATTKPFHELLQGEFEINRLIVRCSYLIAIGFLVGALGENAKERRAEGDVITRILRAARAEVGLQGALHAVFTEYARIFSSKFAYLVTEDLNTGRIFVWHAPEEAQEPYVVEDASARVAKLDDLPKAFFAQRFGDGMQVRALEGSAVREFSVASIPALPFHQQPYSSLLACGAQLGHEWNFRLLLVDAQVSDSIEQELRFAERLLSQSMSALYSVYLVRRLRARVGAMERARVARELHDGAIQSLISAEMRADVLRRRASRENPALAADLTDLQELLRKEVLNLRDLMQQMKPVDLGPQQLVDFLADQVDRFRRDSGLQARFITDAVEEILLTPHACREIVRIVQEALVNIRKHAGATNVLVTMSAQDGSYRIIVADDGRGFGFDGTVEFNDLMGSPKGPTIIKERVHGIGGRLAIESHPGHGSRLEIIIPQKGHASHGEQERESTHSDRR